MVCYWFDLTQTNYCSFTTRHLLQADNPRSKLQRPGPRDSENGELAQTRGAPLSPHPLDGPLHPLSGSQFLLCCGGCWGKGRSHGWAAAIDELQREKPMKRMTQEIPVDWFLSFELLSSLMEHSRIFLM